MSAFYPASGPARDRWILERRPERERVDAARALGAFVEEEADENGAPARVATIFLSNRECPWRCLMCDLWRRTLTDTVEAGAIPAQIDGARAALPPGDGVGVVKLYNAGSFFDPKAIPPDDLPAIAKRVQGFARVRRVIVECHPALVGPAATAFRDMLGPRTGLEVALGLETVHPEVLPRLNKRMTVDDFRRAAAFLRAEGIAVRAFVLAGLPFCSEEESLDWARRSIAVAFDCGAGAVSVIPTRAGNGALDALAAPGEFREPPLATLEAAVDFGLSLRRGRVFADVWDLERFRRCARCFERRRARLRAINRTQAAPKARPCAACGDA